MTVSDDRCASATYTGGDANGNGVLDVGETWTYTCTQTLSTGGTYTFTATATGTNTVDDRPVTSAPAQATVTVTSLAGSRPSASPPIRVTQQGKLPPANSRQARRQAPCVAVPGRVSVRAGELTVVRVRIRERGRAVQGTRADHGPRPRPQGDDERPGHRRHPRAPGRGDH